MNPSKDHNNWLNVGEIIRLIKEPVAFYTSHIIEKWHTTTLCGLPLGRCTNPVVCQTKKQPHDLCLSCKGWYDELAKSHRNKDKRQIKWRENCDTSKWPNDPWEVAKFFMFALGDNKMIVNDADSTDLSSLLNVLTWLKDAVFAPDRRVDLNLVKQLRSQVRNPWAHAPDQKLTVEVLNDAFDIANKFVADLNIVSSCDEVKKCATYIKVLQTNGISNVTETELKILNLLRVELGGEVSQMKEELKRLKDDQSSDRQVIKKQEEMLENLEADLKSLQNIVSIQGNDQQFRLKSCIPGKNLNLTGRDTEIKQIISSIVENGIGIVSIVGGPGFGKSTIAVEVSHHLSNDHDIVVIFSFLSHALTLSEVRLRLCHDVGVSPGEDPESSLMFWLRSIQKKVVIVMDNIEQLLESDGKSQFVELVLTLRKNSQQHLQILTTTRTEFTICGQTTVNHKILELDEISSVELLRMCCPDVEVENAYLSELAELCGFVPLALCIAGTIIPDLDDPSELIQWLKVRPMKALKRVQQAFEFSFQKLCNEDKKDLACLSVFNGNFQRNSAKEVIGRDGLETLDFLKNLVSRSLVQKTIDGRYVIHSLIRQFLAEHDGFEHDKAMAQALMVRHFLKMCNSWTLECYSKNGFSTARKSLKKDVHNVEKSLKICTQIQATNMSETEFLANCEIYKSSYRFFHNFSWDLLTETVLTNFSESCMKLAESRDQTAIAITFQYQIAAQIGHTIGRKNAREYADQVETIMTLFKKNEAVLKKDRYLYESCYNLIARYYLNKEPYKLPAGLTKYEFPSDDPKKGEQNDYDEIAEVYILMKSGNLNKILGHKASHKDKEKSKEYTKFAEKSYNEAITLAKKRFGYHQIICILHKLLGDLYFDQHENNKALTFYSRAKNLYKELELDSNEHFVRLLKNCGICLSFLRRYNESVEVLKEARDIVEKLTEKHTPCKAIVYCKLAISCSFLEPDCKEAAEYAKVALKMQTLLGSDRDVDRLQKIADKAEEFVVVQNIIKSLQVKRDGRKSNLKNCIPDKPQVLIGREAEVKQIISSLVEDDCGIVSIVGGPGFGKSTVAVEVSHHLSKEHDIVIIFSFLSHASTVPEVITRLCHDVGVTPGEDPESSLMIWLKSIDKKVVLVMDNIEQLLEKDVKAQFDELLLTLRKNSQQHLQILTTTRAELPIYGETLVNHKLGELDEVSSVGLLRESCFSDENVKNAYLSELATLCDFIPLALCMAGRTIPHLQDPSELIQELKDKPVEESRSSDQCIQRVIESSFQRLNEEDKKGLVCLSVFDGDFHKKYAKEVIGRSDSDTIEFLKNLVSRGLIQEKSDNRFVIYSLIRQFLADHDQFQGEKVMAQRWMVRHFLKMCDSLALDYYSENAFNSARESLKKDSHNVEEMLKMCTQDQRTSLSPNILELLTSSDVYNSPPNFFFSFSLDFLSGTVLSNFFESCIQLAKTHQRPAIEITFQCLVAYLEGRKSSRMAPGYDDRLDRIKAAFDANKLQLKEHRSLFMFCCYFLASHYKTKVTNAFPDILEDDLLPLPDNDEPSAIRKVSMARILMERGNLYKKCGKKYSKEDKKYDEYMNHAESFYSQALRSVKQLLGNHELTCVLYKLLGDLSLTDKRNKQALQCYTCAIDMRKELELDSNEQFVFLLKNCGACLSYLRRYPDSVKTLLEARDMADKLTEKHAYCRTSVYCELAKTCRNWKGSEFTTL